MKNGKKKVVAMSQEERWAEHYRRIIKKIGFYLRKRARKNGTIDYGRELNVLGEQASQLKIKMENRRQARALGQDTI